MSSETVTFTRTPESVEDQPSNIVYAMIAATIATAFQGQASILSVRSAPSIVQDPQMFHWSLEGRRAIYSSHQIR